MIRRILLLSAFTVLTVYSFAQTVVWSENFDPTPATWTLNTVTGPEDSNPNVWYISCQEEGVGTGNCGTACTAGDQTLHVSADPAFGGDLGAAYAETGFAFSGTNRRAESGNISTVGQTNLTLSFDMIGFGGNAQDFCDLQYSTNGGAAWTSLATPLTAACCGGPCNGGNQGLWQTNTYALPAACENIPNLRIGFVWINLDDGVATDPSFAVDNMQITTPAAGPLPVASFTPSQTTICAGDCITFTDNSTSTPGITQWDWVFTNGTPGTANTQNPGAICFNTAGTHNVTLTVTDANGSDDTTIAITVNNCSQPTASFTPSQTTICAGDCITFTDNSTGSGITNWDWVFTNGTPGTANGQNPGSICFNTAGTHNVTLTVTDANGTDDTTIAITVNNCANPTASFTPSLTSICQGDCITFTDNSTGTGITGWQWVFNTGTPANANTQNPGSVCFNTVGTHDVVLTVTDANGSDDTTIQITVNNCTVPVAAMSFDTLICEGDCIDFTDLSTGNPTMWEWTFGGGVPSASTNQNPTGVCFDNAGNFTIELIATNSVGADTITANITVLPAPIVTAGPDIFLTSGTSVTITAVGDPGTYVWSPGTSLSCTICQSTTASPSSDITYTVTVVDSNGCTASDDVNITINYVETIGIPNAFSPNGDGHNDVLYVKGDGWKNQNFRWSIYNRYGQLVFETVDPNEGWDGTMGGKELNPGVFVYVVEYKFNSSDAEVLKGDVTLVK